MCAFPCSPCDRNLRDVELISCRLRRVEPLCRLPGSALQQLAMCGFYEDLEKGVTRKWHYYINYVHQNNALPIHVNLHPCSIRVHPCSFSILPHNNFKHVFGFFFLFSFLVSVFRAGEQGRFWYAVLGGSLEVRYHAHSDADGKVSALAFSSRSRSHKYGISMDCTADIVGRFAGETAVMSCENNAQFEQYN